MAEPHELKIGAKVVWRDNIGASYAGIITGFVKDGAIHGDGIGNGLNPARDGHVYLTFPAGTFPPCRSCSLTGVPDEITGLTCVAEDIDISST